MAIQLKGISVLSRTSFGSVPVQNGGSISFNGAAELQVAASSAFSVGTGDFTLEWFHRQTTTAATYPRIMQFGGYPSQFGVSIQPLAEMYFWFNGSFIVPFTITGGQFDTWHHFAITRAGSTVRSFQNGVVKNTATNTSNINVNSTAMSIGRDPSDSNYFNGQITNLHFVVGTAKYTSAFTPPVGPISPMSGSQLLLRSTTAPTYIIDSSAAARTVTVAQGTPAWSALTPFV